MKKSFVIKNLVLAMGLVPLMAQAIVAGNMATVERTWPSMPGGYHDMEFSATITKEPGFDGKTYWAHQWGYAGTGAMSGYLGLQSTDGDGKRLNFAIWGALDWKKTGSATCQNFSHEGSGIGCSIDYPWKEGVTYHLKIENTQTDGWTASIVDTSTGDKQTVATIIVPDYYGGLAKMALEWTENFAQSAAQQPATCQDVKKAVVTFGLPTANGGSVLASSSKTYTKGPCASVARATCSTDQACTQVINMPVSSEPVQLKNPINQYCVTHKGAGNVAVLDDCAGTDAQRFVTDDVFRLKNAADSSLCLAANQQNDVVVAKCDDSGAQRWLPVNRTQALYNPGTGQCLDSQDEGAFGAQLRTYSCLENAAQRWEISEPSNGTGDQPDQPDQPDEPDQPGQSDVPAYSSSTIYPTQCTSVSYNGQIWQNQWYVNAGQEEPGTGGAWGAWRAVGDPNNSCK